MQCSLVDASTSIYADQSPYFYPNFGPWSRSKAQILLGSVLYIRKYILTVLRT